MGQSTIRHKGKRVEYDYPGGFVEWYENRPQGLKQGFTITTPPIGAGKVVLTGQYPPTFLATLSPDEQRIDFLNSGHTALVYDNLRVLDSTGKEVAAHFAVVERNVQILIDDREASYPLEVDPLMTSPSWTAESNQSGALFGFSVSTAGDVNADGHSDVIVGARYYDNGEVDEGRAFVFLGSTSGLSTTPSWTTEGNQAAAEFGFSVSTAGDINRDGYGDVVVGAPNFDNGQIDEGRALVFMGSASGLSTVPAWIAENNQVSAHLGTSVSTAGDVDADGYGDVIIGAPSYDNDQIDEGAAYVFNGSSSGLSLTPTIREGDQSSCGFGTSVSTAGDMNGDSYGDVIVGAPLFSNDQSFEGRAYVYKGAAFGLDFAPAWFAESNSSGANFGYSVSTAGDVNGDGYGDITIGADNLGFSELTEGVAYVFPGSSSFAVTSPWSAQSNQVGAHLGTSISIAGDINGDGYSDIIVGAPLYDNGETDEGMAFAWFGSSSGLGNDGTPQNADWKAEGGQISSRFGTAVATPGDVNGDGFSDVIVGAAYFDNGESDEGRALSYYGSASGLSSTPAWTMESNQVSAELGTSVSTAGDVNGDGFGDVIVGAPYYDNGLADEGSAFVYLGSSSGLSATPAWTAESNQAGAHFGFAVSTAQDVDGDGYSDVIVGAPLWDGGDTDEGRAYIYLGSASGLSTTPDVWPAEANQPGAEFGISLSNLGDVNGDGYGDVIVGAHLYDNGQTDEGRAYVYIGFAGGLYGPVWTAEGNQVSADFGRLVSAAGDINRDGFSDALVGAWKYENNYEKDEGQAYVYLGSAPGLSTSPTWTGEGDQLYAFFGFSGSTAGDVNGDGFGDILIGAYGFNNGETDEGRAYVYLGSDTGLSTTPSWTSEANQPYAQFGKSVSTAGDVNGDGYSDVVVGAPQYSSGETSEGRAYVYLGSITGLSTTATTIMESNLESALFGSSVAPAGDIDGDGFGDVVVGSPEFSNGQGKEGRAFLYLGNEKSISEAAVALRPRQYRWLTNEPIDLLGNTNNFDRFNVKARARSSAGRAKIRLEWNVADLDHPYGNGIVEHGLWFDTGDPVSGLGSARETSAVIRDLVPATSYRWRLRSASDSPYFPHSPWLTVAPSVPSLKKLRTADLGIAHREVRTKIDRLAGLSIQVMHLNPFAARTTIKYSLPIASHVRLSIYDVFGRCVATLLEGYSASGEHVVPWEGRRQSGALVSSGIYFAEFEAMGEMRSKKIVLLR